MGKRKERDIRFYEALQIGNLDEVKDFIDHDGIDVNEHIEYSNISDLPLCIASQYGHLPIVQYLVEECKVDVEAGGIGFTAVYYACCLGHLDIVRYLAKKCHVNLEGGTYRSYFYTESVLVHTTSSRHAQLEIIQFLVQECHVNVNSVSSYNEYTALHFAVIHDRLDIIECLTLHGHADVEKKDINGFTPFLRACNGSNFKAVKYLIQNCNANVDVRDKYGGTALHICCDKWYATDIGQFLISECHANVETTDCKGRTPLHIACRHGKIDTVRYLIQDGHANVEATDNDGYNALCHIGKCDDLNTIRFLVQECYLNLFTHLSKEQTV